MRGEIIITSLTRRSFLKAFGISAFGVAAALVCGCTGDNGGPASTEGDRTGSDGGVSTGISGVSNHVDAAVSTTEVDNMGGDLIRGCAQNIGTFFAPFKQGNQNEYGWPALESLGICRQATGEWEQLLATGWERDDDKHTLTIKINKNAYFSNGYPLTAEDVVFTHRSRLEYGTGSAIGNPIAIETPDDETVIFTWADFSLKYELWVLPQFIYSQKVFEENGEDWMLNNIIGTGPYVVDTYTPDVLLKFVRNENYWRPEMMPPCDTMTWLYMPEVTTQIAAFLNGEIDCIIASSAEVVDQLLAAGYQAGSGKDDFNGQFHAVPLTITPEDPLANVNVRRAIFEHGIDWDELAMTVGGSVGYHTDCIGLTSMAYYRPEIERSRFDPELARKELANAGYPDGFSTVIYCGDNNTAGATVLQEKLKLIGVIADVQQVEATKMQSDYIGARATQTGICISGFAYPAANQTDRFIKHTNPTATYGPAHVWSDEIRALWDAVRTAHSQEEENEALYRYVECYVHKECAVWPMYNTRSATFFQEWCHYSDKARLSYGTDPFEVWVEAH